MQTERSATGGKQPVPASGGGWPLDLTPALVTAWVEGYTAARLRADVFAGLTVAIIAIPLSMAIAVGSGGTPGQGLVTAIVGGFLISALGGSRHQIGGPAAAFIVLVGTALSRHGHDGLMTAMFLAGIILVIAGLLRLGSYIAYVSGPVILGFTSAVGVLIVIGQLKDLLGLAGTMPLETVEKLAALWHSLGTFRPAAVGLGLATIAIIAAVKRLVPRAPALLVAVLAGSLAAAILKLDVETIGDRFGPIMGLPAPHLPDLSPARIVDVLGTAFTLAFLIGIESLLSAVAADAVTGERHRPNAEVVGQGIANAGVALFGGLPATGVFARTGANIAAGAETSLSGMLHAAFVLVAVIALGSWTAHLPMTCLAAVLVVSAWRLIDVREVVSFFRRAPRDDSIVLATTFLLTVFADLNVAIATGVAFSSILLVHRLSEASAISTGPTVGTAAGGEERRGLAHTADTRPSPWRDPLPEGVRMFDFRGPLFFGQALRVADAVKALDPVPRVLILRMREVPLIDATATAALDDLATACRKAGCRLVVSSLQPQPRIALHRAGFLRANKVILAKDGFEAVAIARKIAAR